MAKSKLTNEEGRLTLTNAQILDTVRKYAPNDYQQRIPATTQGSVAESLLERVSRAYRSRSD